MTTYTKLKFDKELIAEMRSSQPTTTRFGAVAFMAFLMVVVAAAGYGAYRYTFPKKDITELTNLAHAIVAGMQSGQVAEDAAGQPLADGSDIRQMRELATAAGLDWRNAVPIAFSGVRADLVEESQPGIALTTLTGDVYLSSAGGLFTLEVSATHSENGYALTDVWNCARVDISTEGIESHAAARYDAFRSEPDPAASGIQIESSQHVFVRF